MTSLVYFKAVITWGNLLSLPRQRENALHVGMDIAEPCAQVYT